MSEKLNYFRPKARHIFTIGRDLIKDDFSALIELVKNSYDADATKVDIIFENINDENIKITIRDDGHGMSEDIIRGKWLVPSTDNKKIDKKSPKGRNFQGQKGIGRYATSILGNHLKIITVNNGIVTILSINWLDFNNNDKYLDEIELNIVSKKTEKESGTYIEIIGDKEKLNIWLNKIKQYKFKIELEKLKPPFDNIDNFSLTLNYFGNKDEISNNSFIEYFDYKIEGTIDNKGLAKITYINNDTKKEEYIENVLKIESKDNDINGVFRYPGNVKFNLLALDLDDISKRQKVSINYNRNVIRSNLIDYFKNYAGVSIYRGGFRIRPYGEKSEDWLHLNSRRVNNPTLRLSTNQLLGYITIDSEDESGLIEASSREKLKENEYFYGLIYELRQIIGILEEKRYRYRGEVGLRDKKIKEINIEEKIEKLQEKISNIENDEDKNKVIEETKRLGDDFKKEKDRLENIITQYEGQVTLGKLLSITFHEVAKPTKFMRENIVNIKYFIEKIEKKFIGGLGEFGENLLEILHGYEINSKIVSDFMVKNLQPFVRGKGKPTYFNLFNTISQSLLTFNYDFEQSNINLNAEIDKKIEIYGYERDYIVAFTNFLDNSIYWLNESSSNNKKIYINTIIKDNLLELYFNDNGFGLLNIDDNDDILEPGFSRKEGGSGLGLSIAGEVLNKNDTDLVIIGKNNEFNFTLKLIIREWKK